MRSPVKVLPIDEGYMMLADPMRDLFARAYADPKFEVDADELREWLVREIENPSDWIKLFVAWSEEAGLRGMALLSFADDPRSRYPWIDHFYADHPEVTDALADATLGYFRSRGFLKFLSINLSEHSDEAIIARFTGKAVGAVKASIVSYEMEK
jgi:hypothetical protein